MSELHKFIFDGLPVRGILVQLTDAWQEILQRRQAAGGYPPEVMNLLGEMTAAALLLQGSISFDGTLIFQIFGDGPLKLAVVEVQSDLSLRATATVVGPIESGCSLSQLVNTQGQGRCVITLDAQQPDKQTTKQKTYQSVVPLQGNQGEKLESLAHIMEHYMRQSEQLDTQLVLAADDLAVGGLLIQRVPVEGQGNLQATAADADQQELAEHYNRIAVLASSLQRQELLTLDAQAVLHRLFWEEQVRVFEPVLPSFACRCSRLRVSNMLLSLGQEEVQSVIAERGQVEVGCEFCGAQYQFDPIDAAQIFASPSCPLPPAPGVQ